MQPQPNGGDQEIHDENERCELCKGSGQEFDRIQRDEALDPDRKHAHPKNEPHESADLIDINFLLFLNDKCVNIGDLERDRSPADYWGRKCSKHIALDPAIEHIIDVAL